jgi:hypothetical protein
MKGEMTMILALSRPISVPASMPMRAFPLAGIDTPCSRRRTAASLNSFVNCLRDNAMAQFSPFNEKKAT